MRSFISITMCLSFIFVLAGCYSDAPSPVPRGYSSYDKAVKSVDGAEAGNIGYNYSIEKNKAALDDMLPAAKSLALLLDEKLTFGVDEIYLNIPANTAFYNSFDYLLRSELMDNGYILVSSPIDAVRVDFVAKVLDSKGCGANNTYLALAINVVDESPAGIVGEFYNVPLYGYRPAGKINIDIPQCLSE